MAPSRTALPPATRALARYAAAMALRDLAGARAAVRAARAAGACRVAAEETGLMLMLYAGYPAALEGLRVLNEAWPGRARRSRVGRAARRPLKPQLPPPRRIARPPAFDRIPNLLLG